MNKITESPSIKSSNYDGKKGNSQEPGAVLKLQMNSNILSNDNSTAASINHKVAADSASVILKRVCNPSSNPEQQKLRSRNNNLSNLKQNYAVNNFKDQCLQQFCTNALSPYHSGAPPSFMRSPAKSFNKHCCTDCGDTFVLKVSLNLHLRRHSVLIKFPCETCKSTHIFFNPCNLLSHIRNHTDKNESADLRKAVFSVLPHEYLNGIKNDFVNKLDDGLNAIEDNATLLPRELLECHLREEHFSPLRVPGSSKSDESVSSSSVFPAFGRNWNFSRSPIDNVVDLQMHLKRKHDANNEISPISPVSESTEQSIKKERNGDNSCAKCDFTSSNREEFKKHILSHKSSRTTFQCQECGTCFVVIGSLKKHLLIVHKISDTEKYVSEEGTNFTPDLENSTEVDLLCSVCYTFFPNERSLKKHIRSHGMAFLQACKSGLS